MLPISPIYKRTPKMEQLDFMEKGKQILPTVADKPHKRVTKLRAIPLSD